MDDQGIKERPKVTQEHLKDRAIIGGLGQMQISLHCSRKEMVVTLVRKRVRGDYFGVPRAPSGTKGSRIQEAMDSLLDAKRSPKEVTGEPSDKYPSLRNDDRAKNLCSSQWLSNPARIVTRISPSHCPPTTPQTSTKPGQTM